MASTSLLFRTEGPVAPGLFHHHPYSVNPGLLDTGVPHVSLMIFSLEKNLSLTIRAVDYVHKSK